MSIDRKLLSSIVGKTCAVRWNAEEAAIELVELNERGAPIIDLTTGQEKIVASIAEESFYDGDGNHFENDIFEEPDEDETDEAELAEFDSHEDEED